MNKITKREKNLLIFMLVILVGAAVFYLIYTPVVESVKTTEAQLNKKSDEMMAMQSLIANREKIEMANGEASTELAKKQRMIKGHAYDEVLDARMILLLEDNGLAIDEVTMTSDTAKDLMLESNLEEVMLKKYSVRMHGTPENYMNFMEAVYAETDMGITMFSYDDDINTGDTVIAQYSSQGYDIDSQCSMDIVIGMAVEAVDEVVAQ